MSEEVILNISAADIVCDIPRPDAAVPETFNADVYLKAFPDVARAIADGMCGSPLQHYLEYGQREGRLTRDDYLIKLRGRPLRGHIDFYGHSSVAGGWILSGWTSEPWDAETAAEIGIQFRNAKIFGPFLSMIDQRHTSEGGGWRFVLFIKGTSRDSGPLDAIVIRNGDDYFTICASESSRCLGNKEIGLAVRPLLAALQETENGQVLLTLLSTRGYGRLPADFNALEGFVDWYGYHTASGGWFLTGWTTRSWDADAGPETILLHFGDQEIVAAEAVTGFFPRDDIEGLGTGFVMFVYAQGRPSSSLSSLELQIGDHASFIQTSTHSQRYRDVELLGRVRPLIGHIVDADIRDVLASKLSRTAYSGSDTIGSLSDRIMLEFDAVIACPPGGLVITGWLLAKPGVIRSVRLCTDSSRVPVDLDKGIKIDRPDVISAIGTEHGFDDPRCGFIVYVPGSIVADPTMHVEIETVRHQVGYRKLPEPKLDGIAAIRRILDVFQVRFGDVLRVFDSTVGPPVELLNQQRLATRPKVDLIEFGCVTAEPRYSVIIPLYGRLDFVEYQMAFMAEHASTQDCEFIYVLDDPPKRAEALYLFNSVHNRFGVPFRAVLLEHNVGFAPANNIGLHYANGAYICFLNSDVFPGTPDWLERLAARLDEHSDLGAVGPLLIYGDGTVQHEGMTFKKLQEFGAWHFPDHPRKGLRKSAVSGLRKHISITGACMLLRAEVARDLGGFDESFVIGDFEDSDLCLRLEEKGLASAVDLDVTLYHLERKSQATSARTWRMNLTLYNAWVHERRWGETIAKHAMRDKGLAWTSDASGEAIP